MRWPWCCARCDPAMCPPSMRSPTHSSSCTVEEDHDGVLGPSGVVARPRAAAGNPWPTNMRPGSAGLKPLSLSSLRGLASNVVEHCWRAMGAESLPEALCRGTSGTPPGYWPDRGGAGAVTSVVGSDSEGQEMMQGDWVRLAAPFQLPACPDEPVSDVVIISQTCDVVQKTRKCILIAPIAQASEDDYREAARGKRPLLLAFPAQDDALVVLLEHATSVPKTLLADALLVRRMSCEPASRTARDFARRVGSAYLRFPMPDEAIPALSKFTDRIRKEAPKDRIR